MKEVIFIKDKLSKRWKFLLTSPIHQEAQKLLEPHAEFILSPAGSSSAEIGNLMQKQQTEALIVRAGEINREVLIASTQLRVIVKHGVGYNNIDIKVATELSLKTYKINLL